MPIAQDWSQLDKDIDMNKLKVVSGDMIANTSTLEPEGINYLGFEEKYWKNVGGFQRTIEEPVAVWRYQTSVENGMWEDIKLNSRTRVLGRSNDTVRAVAKWLSATPKNVVI